MRRCLATLAAVLALAAARPAFAGCDAPAPGNLAAVSATIVSRVQTLELALTADKRKARPTVFLRIADNFDPTLVYTSVPSDIQARLGEFSCIDKERLARNIISSVQSSQANIAFISSLSSADLELLSRRINTAGVGHMDAATVSALAVRDVNYVVIVGGRSAVSQEGCGLKLEFRSEIAIHSIASTEIQQASDIPALVFGPPSRYDKALETRLLPPAQSQGYGTIAMKALYPVCLNRATASFEDSSGIDEGAKWTFEGGCLLTGDTRNFTPKADELSVTTWPEKGDAWIKGKASCGYIRFSDIAIRATMAPGWKPVVVAPPQPPPPPPNPGLLPGSQIGACGCWGPVMLNTMFPTTACASGSATYRSCGTPCYPAGFAYTGVCN